MVRGTVTGIPGYAGRPHHEKASGFHLDGVALSNGNDQGSWHTTAPYARFQRDDGIESLYNHYYGVGDTQPFAFWPHQKLSEAVRSNGGSLTVCRAPTESAKSRRAFAERERRTNVGAYSSRQYSSPKKPQGRARP